MIDFAEAVRLARLQERLRHATYHAIREDGHHKSSEGAIELSFCLPPVVGDERDPYWSLEVYSYLLIKEGRTQTFIGKSAAEVISKAEDAADQWCFRAEMNAFEQACGIGTHGPDDPVPVMRRALEMIADPATLPANDIQRSRKWHCQHEEMLSAASEVARDALGDTSEDEIPT